MRLNEEKFQEELEKHKKNISRLCAKCKTKPDANSPFNFRIARLKDKAKELALAYSGYKCQKCGSEERLSWHHLVFSRAKEYMPFDRYLAARYYWNNIIILCWVCHKEYHHIMDMGKSENETDIPLETIEKSKKKYWIE